MIGSYTVAVSSIYLLSQNIDEHCYDGWHDAWKDGMSSCMKISSTLVQNEQLHENKQLSWTCKLLKGISYPTLEVQSHLHNTNLHNHTDNNWIHFAMIMAKRHNLIYSIISDIGCVVGVSSVTKSYLTCEYLHDQYLWQSEINFLTNYLKTIIPKYERPTW